MKGIRLGLHPVSTKRSSTVETAELNDCLPYENLRILIFLRFERLLAIS
jgi:hypothetical protein